MKNNKPIVRLLNDGAVWLESQVGKPITQPQRDKVENLIVAALMCLFQSHDPSRYLRWIAPHGMTQAIRDRQIKFVTKKWNRLFCRLIRLAISDLEALPSRIPTGIPLGQDQSPAQLERLEKARAARKQKALKNEAADNTCRSIANSQTLQNKGSERPEIATFGNPSDFQSVAAAPEK